MLLKKEAKAIKRSNNFPSFISCLCGLNDGRLAIGGNSLVIYNMESYKIDIYINDFSNIVIPLKGNKLFYGQMGVSSEGPWIDESISCHLIEFSKNDYVDKTDILPNNSDYNILYEISDNTLLVGRYYKQQNNDIRDRIVKLIKTGEKFEEALNIKADGLINFIILKNNIFAVLRNNVPNVLCFYEIDSFKCIKYQFFSPETNIISVLNEKYMLIGSDKEIILYDYINYKSNKKIKCVYPLYKIYINNYKVFICESEKCKNQIIEYEFDYDGNYKKAYTYLNPQKKLIDLTLIKDGRLITCSEENVKIWYDK
jgi:hypothetical protein